MCGFGNHRPRSFRRSLFNNLANNFLGPRLGRGEDEDALRATVRGENTVDSDFAKANFECLCHLPVIAGPDFGRGILWIDVGGGNVVGSGLICGADRVSQLGGAFSFDFLRSASFPSK